MLRKEQKTKRNATDLRKLSCLTVSADLLGSGSYQVGRAAVRRGGHFHARRSRRWEIVDMTHCGNIMTRRALPDARRTNCPPLRGQVRNGTLRRVRAYCSA